MLLQVQSRRRFSFALLPLNSSVASRCLDRSYSLWLLIHSSTERAACSYHAPFSACGRQASSNYGLMHVSRAAASWRFAHQSLMWPLGRQVTHWQGARTWLCGQTQTLWLHAAYLTGTDAPRRKGGRQSPLSDQSSPLGWRSGSRTQESSVSKWSSCSCGPRLIWDSRARLSSISAAL